MNRETDRLIKTENVYEHIYLSINQGKILPGDTLTERNIAAKVDVSRTPVREAFRKLEQDGIVTFEPYKGIRVMSYTKQEIAHLYSVRGALEVLSVEICVQKENEILINSLNQLIEKAKQAVTENNIIKLRDINSNFHSQIAQYTQNPYLISTLNNLQTKIDMFMTKSLSNKGRPQKNIEEHQRIIWAIQEKDIELARSLVKFHIKKSLENVLYNLDE